MKISLALIVKDEEAVLERCLKSAQPFVDEIVVVDTGSKDKTKQIASKFTKKVFDFEWIDDFSAARNFSFEKCSGDWILWLDADDVLMHGEKIRELLNEVDEETQGVRLMYWYEIDDKGNVMTKHWKDRLIRNNHLTEWRNRVHENISYLGDGKVFHNEEIVVLHLPTSIRRAKRIDQNVDILEKELKDQGDQPDPRTLFYLGNAYWSRKDFSNALHNFDRYLKLSGWDEERYQALCTMAKIRLEMLEPDRAIERSLAAMKERPDYPGSYFLMAEAYFLKEDWNKVEEWCKVGFKKKMPKESQVIFNPRDYDLRPLTLLAAALYEMGRMKEALEAIDKALTIKPEDEYLMGKRKEYQEMEDHKEVTLAIDKIATFLLHHGQAEKINRFLETIPKEHEMIPLVQRIGQTMRLPMKWGKDSIVIFCGPSNEVWSPKSELSGIGGSEEAVINMARELTKLGWKVTVYNSCFDEAGVYDGVTYKNYVSFNPQDFFNILIDWRGLNMVATPLSAKKTYTWLHDVPNPNSFTPPRVARLEKIIALSRYHRSFLPNVPEEKFFLSTNGINPDDFKQKVTRDPYKVVYISSYDRGLEYLLDVWPEVKKAIPQATLDIYYGWEGFEARYKDNPERMGWATSIKEQIRSLEGVEEYGRVGHKDLARAILGAGVWAYPTDFEEISCISAMKAQAAGAVPVVTNFAALKETVQWGIKVSVDIKTKSGQAAFKDNLIGVLEKGMAEKEREAAMEFYQKKFAWENVAKEWDQELKAPPVNNRPKISVVTITIRPGPFAVTYETLAKQTFKDFEWVIVDDLWTTRKEEVKEFMKDKGIRYKHVPSKVNPRKFGIANANNTAIHEASGELVVFLQDFIEMPSDGLQRFWDVYQEKGNVLIAGVDDRINTSAPIDIEDKIDIFKGQGYQNLGVDWVNERAKGKATLRKTGVPFDFEMNYAAVPMRVLHKLGGFLEEFDEGFGYDNTEFALRALISKFDIWIDGTNRAHALNHWNWYPKNSKHNVEGREDPEANNTERYDKLFKDLLKGERSPTQLLPFYDKKEEIREIGVGSR